MTDQCDELHARVAMLHEEADRSLSAAEAQGVGWAGHSDQIAIALRCETIALQVKATIAEDC